MAAELTPVPWQPLQSSHDDIPNRPAADPAPIPDAGQLAVLLDASRKGDAGAFTEIYGRFVRVVHGIVLAAVGNNDAEDLTQEVFMKVHRSIDSVRDAAALPGWICTVARNAVLDHGRRRQRRPKVLHLVTEPVAANDGDDLELGPRVLELIRGLPESYRTTLVLRLVEGLTGPQIADRTGMSHGSVRVNLSRGMGMLRPLLEKEGWS